MQSLQTLLTDSIDRYQNIIQLMKSMVTEDSIKPIEHLVTTGTEILTKQKAVGMIDETIVQTLSSYDDLTENDSLVAKLTEWMDIQKQLILLNKKVTPKLESIQSLVNNEHNCIRAGRTAIRGYGIIESSHGKNINNSL